MDTEINQEIVDIFIEEVADVQLLIEQHLPNWQAHADDKLAVQEIRRAFHTLKGSGKMVQAEVLAELGFAFEHALNDVIQGHKAVTPALQQSVAQSLQVIPDLLQDFVDGKAAHSHQGQALIDKLQQQPSEPEKAMPDNAEQTLSVLDESLLQRIEQLEKLMIKTQQQQRFYKLTPALCGLILLAVIGLYFI